MKTRLEVDAIARVKRDARAAVDDDAACRQRVVVREIGGAGADGLVGHLGRI
jgi:hypothetical protein